MYGSKYSEYYLRTIHSQQITIAFTLFVLSFILYGLASDVLALIVGFVFAGLAYYYFGTVTKKKEFLKGQMNCFMIFQKLFQSWLCLQMPE